MPKAESQSRPCTRWRSWRAMTPKTITSSVAISGCDQTQAPDAQRLDLKDEPEDHAQDPQEPHRAAQEVADEVKTEAQLLGRRSRRPALCHRRGSGEPAGDQRQHDDLSRHSCRPLQLQLPQSTTPMVVSTQLVHKSSRHGSREREEIADRRSDSRQCRAAVRPTRGRTW